MPHSRGGDTPPLAECRRIADIPQEVSCISFD
jgi:hypothetical protein